MVYRYMNGIVLYRIDIHVLFLVEILGIILRCNQNDIRFLGVI